MYYNPFQMMANGNSLTQGGLRMGMQPSMMNGLFGYSPYQSMGGYGGSMGGYGMGGQQANPMQMWMSQQYQPGGGNPMGSYTPEQYLPLAGQLGGMFNRVTGYAPDSKAASWIADMYKGGLGAEQIRTAIENQHWGRNTPIGAPTNGQSPNATAAAQQAAAEQAGVYSPFKEAPTTAGRGWGDRVGDFIWSMPQPGKPGAHTWDGKTQYSYTDPFDQQASILSSFYSSPIQPGINNNTMYAGMGPGNPSVTGGEDMTKGMWLPIEDRRYGY